jgi:subtilisin-like proprotein convertase family protein
VPRSASTDLPNPSMQRQVRDEDLLQQLAGYPFKSVLRVERAMVTVSLQYKRRGDVVVKLKSPHGTISTLANYRPRDKSALGLSMWQFVTAAHWSEEVAGIWELIIYGKDGALSGNLAVDWDLRFSVQAIPPGFKEQLDAF